MQRSYYNTYCKECGNKRRVAHKNGVPQPSTRSGVFRDFGKVCRKCRVYKLLDAFPVGDHGKGGFRGCCFDCVRTLKAPKPPKPTKECSRCKQVKPVGQFHHQKSRHGKLYPRGECKACQKAWFSALGQTPHRRSAKLRCALKRYGLTPASYRAMLKRQGGVCASCRQPETAIDGRTRRVKRLANDHDKSKGPHAVRGLLCTRCNPGIGFFNHDPALLRAAAEYCERTA